LSKSEVRSVQPEVHTVNGQLQTPEEQVSFGSLHTFPQAPQFCVLEVVSTHPVPLQNVPAVQLHAPAEHVAPLPQATPHVPQLFGSDVRSRQIDPQLPCPAAQHAPAEHVVPAAQTRPHAPQLSGSDARTTQAAPH
jgi:hypothetical protein